MTLKTEPQPEGRPLTVQFLLGCDACGGQVEHVDDTICSGCREEHRIAHEAAQAKVIDAERQAGARDARHVIDDECWTVKRAAQWLEDGEYTSARPCAGLARFPDRRGSYTEGFTAVVRAAFRIPAATRIKFDADSEETCTLAALIAENQLDDETIRELLALEIGESTVLGQCDVVKRVADDKEMTR